MLGLKRGTVMLCPHEEEWERIAAQTIAMLRPLFGEAASAIEHVGSTSIRGIRAKPILDLAVAARDMEAMRARISVLEAAGVIFRGEDHPGEYLFVMGDFDADTRTHHIHVCPEDGEDWRNYLLFRDYLNANPDCAAEYDRLKGALAEQYADDRARYTAGKQAFIAGILEEARRYRDAIQSQSTLS
ncbi:MAG: GrpB family protein [Clostridia bacterium]|nr:GrpB family protein [Clostridia bacterium]